MSHIALSSLAAAIFAVPLLAQNASDQLLANTQGLGLQWPAIGSVKLVTQDVASCKSTACTTKTEASFQTHNGTNGGAAYDSIRGGVWISNGGKLSCINPDTCEFICKEELAPFAALGPRELSPYPQEVGGLAFDAAENTLYMVDARNHELHQVRLGSKSDPRACEFRTTKCKIDANMPPGYYPSGLAIDMARRLLFVASYDFTSKQSHIYTTPLEKWCSKLCDVTDANGNLPGPCPNLRVAFQGITGLAFNSCKSVLYVTDGAYTSEMAFAHIPTAKYPCQVKPISCCPVPKTSDADTWRGLALRPASTTTNGRPCTVKPCSTCPTMVAGFRGDAAMGNFHFALTLSNAPNETTVAVAAIGFGPCTSGINVGLCAPLMANLTGMFTLGVPMNASVASCSSHGVAPLPIPNDVKLCGLSLSAQWLPICVTPVGVGHGLSNCTSFSVSH